MIQKQTVVDGFQCSGLHFHYDPKRKTQIQFRPEPAGIPSGHVKEHRYTQQHGRTNYGSRKVIQGRSAFFHLS